MEFGTLVEFGKHKNGWLQVQGCRSSHGFSSTFQTYFVQLIKGFGPTGIQALPFSRYLQSQSFKTEKRCIFSLEFSIHFKVGNGTIDLGGHQAT